MAVIPFRPKQVRPVPVRSEPPSVAAVFRSCAKATISLYIVYWATWLQYLKDIDAPASHEKRSHD